jgi:hypothetical protein
MGEREGALQNSVRNTPSAAHCIGSSKQQELFLVDPCELSLVFLRAFRQCRESNVIQLKELSVATISAELSVHNCYLLYLPTPCPPVG